MMDIREKLYSLIDESGACFNCFPCEGYEKEEKYKIADYLLANGVTVQEWIPVSERLPEVARRVLVTDGENVSFGYVLNYERKDLNPWCTQSPCLPHTTTHWMPLPSVPKGE